MEVRTVPRSSAEHLHVDCQRCKCWGSLWEWSRFIRSGMAASGTQHMLDAFQITSERSDRDGWEMCRGGEVNVLIEGGWRWNWQAGRTPRGRARRRFIDVVKDDMKLAGVKAENVEDWVRWRQLIYSGDAWGEQWKLEEEEGKRETQIFKIYLLTHISGSFSSWCARLLGKKYIRHNDAYIFY